MEDITQIDFKKPFGKRVCVNEANAHKQRAFFVQNGIEYGLDGKPVSQAQVKKYYAGVAEEAKQVADEAMAKAKELADVAKAAGAAAKTGSTAAGK